MIIYVTEMSLETEYGASNLVVDRWDSIESALQWFNTIIKRDDCMFGNLSSVESDGGGRFSIYDLIAEYAAGCDVVWYGND